MSHKPKPMYEISYYDRDYCAPDGDLHSFLQHREIETGLTPQVAQSLLEFGWRRAQIVSVGHATIFNEAPGAVNVVLSNPMSLGGVQFAVMPLEEDLTFFYEPSTGQAVLEPGGNPVLIQELITTGYRFADIEPVKQSIAQTMAPLSILPYPKPVDPVNDPVVKDGLSRDSINKAKRLGWVDATSKNTEGAPFIFKNPDLPNPGGYYLAPMLGDEIDGITNGNTFVAKGCTNEGTCWRWL